MQSIGETITFNFLSTKYIKEKLILSIIDCVAGGKNLPFVLIVFQSTFSCKNSLSYGTARAETSERSLEVI